MTPTRRPASAQTHAVSQGPQKQMCSLDKTRAGQVASPPERSLRSCPKLKPCHAPHNTTQRKSSIFLILFATPGELESANVCADFTKRSLKLKTFPEHTSVCCTTTTAACSSLSPQPHTITQTPHPIRPHKCSRSSTTTLAPSLSSTCSAPGDPPQTPSFNIFPHAVIAR